MKRVLMTNLYFAKYTGSELHTLEMAKLFVKKGYDVTIAVFQKAYPLLEKAEGFRVINCLQEKLEYTDFDIVFMQHYPVFDHLCCNYDLTYRKLIVSKLSVISELEHLPICTPEADLIVCVSQECANAVYEEIGQDSRIKIVKNCASEEYFCEYPARKAGAVLRKIAVISNHIPEELMALSKLLSEVIEMDYIGVDHSPRLVDVDLLKKYDLIITIGRTVQHCFAMGIPVYVYDYFGGPGYITDENFAVAEKNNFSGRGFLKKSALELKKDIEGNYAGNLANLGKFYQVAQKEYSYEGKFEEIYQELMCIPDRKKKSYYQGTEKLRMQLYSKIVPYYAFPKDYFSQLYIDYGDGFCEEDSVKWEVAENYIIKKMFDIEKQVKALRFDPCNVPSEFYIYKIVVNGKTKVCKKRNTHLDFDPQMNIELLESERKAEKLCIELIYKFKSISWEQTIDFYKERLQTYEKQNKLSIIKEKVKNKVRNIK